MSTTTTQFSQSELVELIWTGRNPKTFSLKKKELQAMDIDQLLALATEQGIEITSEPANATPDLSAQGITARNALNGAVVYTIDLPLVHTDGFSFHFQYDDKKVIIAGDLQLAECFENGTVKLGDMLPFHYDGVDTFKTLSGDYLVPNNSGDRAREHSSSGTIAKSFFAPIANLLAEDKLRKAKINLEMLKIAKDNNLKLRQVRNLDREDRVENAKLALKALRGK